MTSMHSSPTSSTGCNQTLFLSFCLKYHFIFLRPQSDTGAIISHLDPLQNAFEEK